MPTADTLFNTFQTYQLTQGSSTVGYMYCDLEEGAQVTHRWLLYPSYAPVPATELTIEVAAAPHAYTSLGAWSAALASPTAGLWVPQSSYVKDVGAMFVEISSTDRNLLERPLMPSDPGAPPGTPFEVDEGTTPVWSVDVTSVTGSLYRDAPEVVTQQGQPKQWYEYWVMDSNYQSPRMVGNEAIGTQLKSVSGQPRFSRLVEFLTHWKDNFPSGGRFHITANNGAGASATPPTNP